jgi:hypothetical protein
MAIAAGADKASNAALPLPLELAYADPVQTAADEELASARTRYNPLTQVSEDPEGRLVVIAGGTSCSGICGTWRPFFPAKSDIDSVKDD